MAPPKIPPDCLQVPRGWVVEGGLGLLWDACLARAPEKTAHLQPPNLQARLPLEAPGPPNKAQAAYARAGREAAGEAVSTYTTAFPTKKQVDSIRKVQAKAKKLLALEKAKAARAAKSAAKAVAAAEKKAAADAKKAADAATKAAAEAQKAAEAEAAKAAAEAAKAAAAAKPKVAKKPAAKKSGKKGSKK